MRSGSEKRRILPESTPPIRIRGHLCCAHGVKSEISLDAGTKAGLVSCHCNSVQISKIWNHMVKVFISFQICLLPPIFKKIE